jgi:hypothetical protein
MLRTRTRNHAWTYLPDGTYRLTWDRLSTTGWNPMARISSKENARRWAALHGVLFYGPPESRGTSKGVMQKLREAGMK